jgi:copper chaperone
MYYTPLGYSRYINNGAKMEMNQTTSSSDSLSFVVPEMSCGHCVAAITEEVSAISGVADVSIDLETKLVVVTGQALDTASIVAAINEAGFDPA